MMSRTSELSNLQTSYPSALVPSRGSYCSEATTAADIDKAATAAETHISIAPDEHLRVHPSASTVEVTSVAPDEHLRGHLSAIFLDEHPRGHLTFSSTDCSEQMLRVNIHYEIGPFMCGANRKLLCTISACINDDQIGGAFSQKAKAKASPKPDR